MICSNETDNIYNGTRLYACEITNVLDIGCADISWNLSNSSVNLVVGFYPELDVVITCEVISL